MTVIFNEKGRRMRTRVGDVKDTFTVANLEAIAEDLKSRRLQIPRTTVTDPMTVGLRALISKTGIITFYVQYDVLGDRPYRAIGMHPEITIAEARFLARTLRELGVLGIDPLANLERDRIAEVLKQGKKWRPAGRKPNQKKPD